MLNTGRILLASHGTRGARAADALAVGLCGPQTALFHLTVVPDLWRGMMGDDWLNNASTRAAYGKHVETELGREIDEHRQLLRPEVEARGARYESRTVVGKPAASLIEWAAELGPDLVIIGSPRPPRTPGLRSRLAVDELVRVLSAPLVVAPFPR